MCKMLPMEERKDIVDQILHKKSDSVFLIDKPLRGIRNRMIQGSCTGYDVILGNLSYRGVWLSTIEDMQLTVDGKKISAEDLYLKIGSSILPVAHLEDYSEVFWSVENECTLWVLHLGGLEAGTHQVAIDVVKRPDFGHHFGNGTEGFEKAVEFTHPDHIHYCTELIIEGDSK